MQEVIHKISLFKKIGLAFKSQSNCVVFILLFLASLLAKTLIFANFIDKTQVVPNLFGVISSTILTGLVFAGIIFIFAGRKTPVFLLFLDLIITLIVVIDCCYFRYTTSPASVALVKTVGQAFNKEMSSSIKNVVGPEVFVVVLPFIIFLISYIVWSVLASRNIFKEDYKVVWHRKIAIGMIVVIFCSSLLYLQMSGKKVFKASWVKSMIINEVGILYYHVYDVGTYIGDSLADKSLSVEEKEKINEFLKLRQTKDVANKKYKGIAKGRNLMIIQIEALQQFVIGQKINGVEITPNLNKLLKTDVYCDNMFGQTGSGNTADAEFITNNSMLAAESGAINQIYSGNKFLALPNAMRKAGYSANVYHSYQPGFWNRNVMFPKLGFERFYSKADFTQKEVIGWSDSDRTFYKQVLDYRDKLGNKPSYTFMSSLSSHFPFTYVNDNKLDLGEFKGTLLGNYLDSIHYADYSLGKLFKDLKKRDEYDNTMIVIYGDHKAMNMEDISMVNKFLGKSQDSNNLEVQYELYCRSPLFIINSGVGAKIVSNTCGQVDILPTITDLLGIKMKYILGRNILNLTPADAGAIKRNGVIVTNKYLVTADNKVFDRNKRKFVDAKISEKTLNFLQGQQTVSDLIFNKNALAQLQ